MVNVKKIDFMTVPELIFQEVQLLKDVLNLDKVILIRDAGGKISLFLTTNEENFNEITIENTIKERLEEHSKQIYYITQENISINDYLGEVFIQNESNLDYFGQYILENYEKYREKRDPSWLIEKHLQFSSWFEEDQTEDMRIQLRAKVVTGYSYKGGMGRTTMVAMLALKAAMEGKSVVVLDFDFEAPGLATLFFNKDSLIGRKGIIDYLVEKPIIKDKLDLDQYNIPVRSDLKGSLRIFPAGLIDDETVGKQNYMQKITRINFNNYASSKNNALTKLLYELDKKYAPDIIFIDSRTGLTEIGGLGTRYFSNLVLAIFSEDDQNLQGMQLILPLIFDEIDIIAISSQLRLRPEDQLDTELFDRFRISLYNTAVKLANEAFDPVDLEDYIEISKLNYYPDLVFPNFDTISNVIKKGNYPSISQIYNLVIEKLYIGKSTSQKTYKFEDKIESLTNIKELKVDADKMFNRAEDFRRMFLFKDDFKFLFQDDTFFITGDKGEGKTALFSLMSQKEVVNDFKEYLIDHKILKADNQWNYDKVVLFKGFGRPDENQPPSMFFDKLYKRYNDDYNKYSIFWEIVVLMQLENYAYQIELITEKFIKCDSINSLYEILKNFDEDLNFIIATRKQMALINSLLEKSGNKIYFIYDELDKEICDDSKVRGPIITGLLSMWYKNAKLYSNIRCKIFLRNDIFENEVEMTNKGHLYDYHISLNWDYKDVLKIMFKYLCASSLEIKEILHEIDLYRLNEKLGVFITDDEERLEEAVRVLFGERMRGGAKAAKVFHWIRKRLSDANDKITPRRIINLLITAAEKELKGSSVNSLDKLISNKSLEEALVGGVSKRAVEELIEEHKKLKPYLNALSNKIDRTVPVDEKILLKAFDEISKSIKNKSETIPSRELLKELISIGVFSEYRKRRNDPIRYGVPEIYLHGLELRRKGRI